MLSFETYHNALLKENVKGRSARYKMMFSKFLKEHDVYEKNIDNIITNCVTNLKKDNVIVFVLKTLRDYMIKLEKEDGDATRAVIQTNTFISALEHYVSLPIPEIKNYNYAGKTRADVIDDFREFESAWQKGRVGWIDITDELEEESIVPIIDYKNGYMWFDLKRAYCEFEGDAMGHCGNSAAYEDGDTVLSYRLVKKINGRVMSRPSLTFILDLQNRLGEMKGRANEKPKEKYHEAIVDLLLDKVRTSSRDSSQKEYRIQGIKGGGYAPENNFHITDIVDENLKRKLFSERPEFEPFADRFNRGEINGEYVKTQLSKNLNVSFEDVEIPVVKSDLLRPYSRYAYVVKWNDWQELFKKVPIPANLDRYENYVENGGFYNDDYRSISEDEVKEFLEKIMEINHDVKDRIMKAINSWLEDYPDLQESGYDVDPSTIDGIYNLLEINDPETIELVKRSINDGENAGAYSSMLKAFKDGIEDLNFITSEGASISFDMGFTNPDNWFDSRIYAIFTLESVGTIIDSQINPFLYDLTHESGDMRESRYGFDGYDDNYAREVFQDQLDI